MAHILDEIVAFKRMEVGASKTKASLDELQGSRYYTRHCASLVAALTEAKSSGIISEFKRKSPSKGWIHAQADVSQIVKAYDLAGVAGISCLTDNNFFGGSKADFEAARHSTKKPILRKEFIIDSYQIHESKAMGADVILLIASILKAEEIKEYTDLAHELGMEVLLELHDKKELERIYDKADLIGVNNRNLKTFHVSIEHSLSMKKDLPNSSVLVSESGLNEVEKVQELYEKGYRGFLMGEYFMKDDAPGKTAKEFISKLTTGR